VTVPEVVTTVAGLQAGLDAVRAGGGRVGFVPTMGYLHAGHGSLIGSSVADGRHTVVSIFVNPLQFAPDEDLDAYPVDLDADLALCGASGAVTVFLPSVDEMYPEPAVDPIAVGAVGRPLEGASRPTHFTGVATVVHRLFTAVGPCHAYFGDKDFQQLAVVRAMAAEHGLPVTVVGCPIVREDDGLAMSSRNVYLTDDERSQAPVVHRALQVGAAAVAGGETDPRAVERLMADLIASAPAAEVDYTAVVDPVTFVTPDRVDGEVRLLVACRFGRARLIDNVGASPGSAS